MTLSMCCTGLEAAREGHLIGKILVPRPSRKLPEGPEHGAVAGFQALAFLYKRTTGVGFCSLTWGDVRDLGASISTHH